MTTLILAVGEARRERSFEPPAGCRMRSSRRSDVEPLGALYHAAYDPGVAALSLEAATADIAASFAGEYGELWLDASPVAVLDHAIVGAVLTVRRAPWDDTPPCPFVIETFVARDMRRRGIARSLLGRCLDVAGEASEEEVALRVGRDNTPALELYHSLGFREWTPPA